MLGYFLESTHSEYYKRNEFLFFGMGKLMFVFPKTGVGDGGMGGYVCVHACAHTLILYITKSERKNLS